MRRKERLENINKGFAAKIFSPVVKQGKKCFHRARMVWAKANGGKRPGAQFVPIFKFFADSAWNGKS